MKKSKEEMIINFGTPLILIAVLFCSVFVFVNNIESISSAFIEVPSYENKDLIGRELINGEIVFIVSTKTLIIMRNGVISELKNSGEYRIGRTSKKVNGINYVKIRLND